MPDALDDADAAATPEAFLTAFDAIVLQAGLGRGDTLLVNGASGGVGTAAVQIAAALGATVVANVRTASLRPGVAALGAEALPADEAFARVQELGGADVMLELVGGAAHGRQHRVARARRPAGAWSASKPGEEAAIVLRDLMSRRGHLMGTTLRTRPPEEKAQLVQAFAPPDRAAAGRGHACAPIVDRSVPAGRRGRRRSMRCGSRASSASCCSSCRDERRCGPASSEAAGSPGCTFRRSTRPTGVDLVAACDIDLALAEAIAGPRGGTAYTDWEEMLEREQLDVLWVCTPPLHHRAPVAAALGARHPRLPREADRPHDGGRRGDRRGGRGGPGHAASSATSGTRRELLDDARAALDGQQVGMLVGRNYGPVAGRPWFMDQAPGRRPDPRARQPPHRPAAGDRR